MALNLIMLGPPGAGKGTQSDRVAAARGIPKISTGEMLREAVKAETEVGQRVRDVVNRGELVGDEVMIGLMRGRLEQADVSNGFILDGFPRTVAQAEALDVLMLGRDPLVIVDIAVPESELVRRLSARLICEACGANAERDVTLDAGRCGVCGGRLTQRSDDNDVVVLERLKIYRRNTQPLVDYYQNRPTFRSVNGAQPLEQVAADLTTAIAAVEGVGVSR